MGPVGASCQKGPQQLVDRPIFHVASRSGWVNDPNAPLYWKGRYHLFYQHVASSIRWSWGLKWGHASSDDLIHWQHHTPALTPSPDTPDADGCFSGCAAILPAGSKAPTIQPTYSTHSRQPGAAAPRAAEHNGEGSTAAVTAEDMPVLLYTGVVKRPDAPAGLRPTSLAVSELCVEQQVAAIPVDLADPYLRHWKKVAQPWLPNPPPDLCLNCFRDPFVLETPSQANNQSWRIMVGAGIRDPDTGLVCAGVSTCGPGKSTSELPNDPLHPLRQAAVGTALVYKSKELFSGWEFDGHLCTSCDRKTEGAVWECPMLIAVPPLTTSHHQQGFNSSSSPGHTHLFCVSAGRSPAIYWLGKYSDGRFDMASAAGPFPLDLGDLLYAPNVLANSKDGAVLWGWLAEQPNPGGTHDYAGCISLPRLLHITPDGHLHQQPLPKLTSLRSGPACTEAEIQVEAGTVRHIGSSNVAASYFDLELTLVPQPATTTGHNSKSCTAGVVVPAWGSTELGPNGSSATGTNIATQQVVGQGALILYDFDSCQLKVLVGNGIGQDLVSTTPHKTIVGTTSLGRYIGAAAATAGKNDSGPRHATDLGSDVRVLGGQLHLRPHEAVRLRIVMDYSLLEVFTGDGQVLSTRVYRGLWPVGVQGKSDSGPGLADHSNRTTVKDDVVVPESASTGRTNSAEVGNFGLDVSGGDVQDSVPCGCYVFADGGFVTAQDVSMSTMQSAWVDEMLN